MAETFVPPETVTLVHAVNGTRVTVAVSLAPKMRGYRAASAASAPEGEPDESWTLPQLRDHAAAHTIDLGGATRKADILAAILAAADESDDDS